MAMNDSLFFADSASGILNSEELQRIKIDGNIMQSKVPLKNGEIILMDHPASVTVYHCVSIEVLSGSVSVFGYEISPRNRPLEIFSSEKTGLIEIKTETFDRIWKKRENSSDLEKQIYNITENKKKTTEILRNFGNSTVAIFVKRCAFPVNLQFLELYHPHLFEFNLLKKTRQMRQIYCVPKSKGTPIQFGLNEEKLASEINIYIRSAKLTDSEAPRILVCGPKNTGKSTLIRFLINKILSVYLVAYYLDTDPGQTEFTPPGSVSLTKVTKPIIGPPFCHQQNPISMIFTGSTSPTSPDVYCKSVSKLMQLYADNYIYEPLFVNTMGWMEGFGLQCLGNVITIVKPTVLVEIVTEDEISMFDYRDYMPGNSHYFQICCSHERKSPYISSKDMRELSLLSYLGKCHSPFLGPMPLNEIKPYCVSWDKIPVYLSHQKVQPYRMIEAICGSIVALCSVPESAILESDIPQFPKTLEDDPDNECIGYGLVQAVDEKEHILYIVAPLKMNEWKKVNAIIKGNITVPDVLILEENIFEDPIPYTDERDACPPDDDDDVEMTDYSMLSLKCISETDSPAPSAAHGSALHYRRKIPKRYRRGLQK